MKICSKLSPALTIFISVMSISLHFVTFCWFDSFILLIGVIVPVCVFGDLLTWCCVACVCVCVWVFQSGLTPLHVAAHYDNQRVALLLLDQGASPHAAAKVSTQTHIDTQTINSPGLCPSVPSQTINSVL